MSRTEVQLDDAALRSLLKSRSGPVAGHLLRVGKTVEGVAKRNAPVDTGRLRASITTALFDVPYDPFIVARVGTDVDYATYVHEGTRYTFANPFLEDALREVLG